MTVVERAVTVLAALSLAAVLLGSAVLVMLAPAYTRLLVVGVGAPEKAGLSVEQTVRHAEEVRAYVSGAPGVKLPERLDDGRPAFDAWAVSHLADVRDVLSRVRAITGMAGFLALGWLVWALVGLRYRAHVLATSLKAAALIVLGVVAAGAAFALLDFGRFFTLFHALFFETGTWIFPSEALLIRLFPEAFWMVSGAVWAGLSLVGATAIAWGAHIVRTRVAATGE